MTPTEWTTERLKPGETCRQSGLYQLRGPEVTVTKGEPLPPVSGARYYLVRATDHGEPEVTDDPPEVGAVGDETGDEPEYPGEVIE